MDEKIKLIEKYYREIKNHRVEIANKKVLKAKAKVGAWTEAEGTAKQKEDYVKSAISEIEKDIDLLEAYIEFAYNMINIFTYELELSDE